MKLYYARGACSLGTHIMLEETGAPYETAAINLRENEQAAPAYRAVNPKGVVPALVLDDGAVLTQYAAIALYLARRFPEARLLPSDALGEARAMEALDYVVGTIHGQGFSRMFRPERVTPSEGDRDAVRAEGRRIFTDGLALMDRALEASDWVAGDYSVADPSLFYVTRWAEASKVDLPPRIAAHAAAMRARPAAQRALAAENLQ